MFRMSINFKLSMVLLLSALSGFSKTSEIVVEPGFVHVPKGFDSNDNVEVVVTGDLRHTCQRRPEGQVTIKGQKILINMKATEVSGKDVVCIQAIVPYMVSVPVGQLREGHYIIAVNPGKSAEKTSNLIISKPSSESIDNFTYANTTNIKISESKGSLILEGAHPSSCMTIDKVEFIPNDTGDTIAVLPIVEQSFEICDRMVKPFSYEFSIPNPEHTGRVFHVRRIDGRALNFMW